MGSMTSQGAYLLKFTKDFITDEPVLFMQQQTPFIIGYRPPVKSDPYKLQNETQPERTRNEEE